MSCKVCMYEGTVFKLCFWFCLIRKLDIQKIVSIIHFLQVIEFHIFGFTCFTVGVYIGSQQELETEMDFNRKSIVQSCSRRWEINGYWGCGKNDTITKWIF